MSKFLANRSSTVNQNRSCNTPFVPTSAIISLIELLAGVDRAPSCAALMYSHHHIAQVESHPDDNIGQF